MGTTKVDIKILAHGAEIPAYQSPAAAGCDLAAAIPSEVKIPPGECRMIPTGVAIHIGDRGIFGMLASRSGLGAKQGVTVAQGVGIIDADYVGEVIVPLRNTSSFEATIAPGQRIAQLLFLPVIRAEFHQVVSLSKTDRGAGGFGSTGA